MPKILLVRFFSRTRCRCTVHKVTSRYISVIWGADPFRPIFRKIGKTVCKGRWRNHWVRFCFQYFRGFRLTGGQIFHLSNWLCRSSLQQCCRYRATGDTENQCLRFSEAASDCRGVNNNYFKLTRLTKLLMFTHVYNISNHESSNLQPQRCHQVQWWDHLHSVLQLSMSDFRSSASRTTLNHSSPAPPDTCLSVYITAIGCVCLPTKAIKLGLYSLYFVPVSIRLQQTRPIFT